MFPRRSLEFIILSTLKEQDGLSGYQILKIVKNSFTFYHRLSPGTFYHQLEKLSKNGDIEQKGDEYFITEQGEKKINVDIPAMMNESMEYLPHLLESLMGSLSKMMQMKVFPKLSCFMGHSLYDVDIFSEDIDFSID
ncbi:MAG: PadR family transcriptional regulator, partial [Candidatus Hodarchaeota archaeon]